MVFFVIARKAPFGRLTFSVVRDYWNTWLRAVRALISLVLLELTLGTFRPRMPSKQWYEDIKEIKRKCRGGALFEDPEFPAIDSKVFKKRVLPGGQSFEWLRPQVKLSVGHYFGSFLSCHKLNSGVLGWCAKEFYLSWVVLQHSTFLNILEVK